MARVYLSLGSNVERHQHLCAGLSALADVFGALTLSSVYESEAVGFEGSNFYNLVAAIDTDMRVGQLSQVLKEIENDNGRDRSGPKFSSRTLDIDILTYDHQSGDVDNVVLPRDEVSKNAFVLLPLAEIAPDEVHPFYGESYLSMWEAYDQAKQPLWTVDFVWDGRQVSKAVS